MFTTSVKGRIRFYFVVVQWTMDIKEMKLKEWCTRRAFVLLFLTNRPIRLTQCCTQFRSLGVKILCALYLHYKVAFTFKWYGNSWNKTFYSQVVWIGYNIELAELVYCFCFFVFLQKHGLYMHMPCYSCQPARELAGKQRLTACCKTMTIWTEYFCLVVEKKSMHQQGLPWLMMITYILGYYGQQYVEF